MNRGQPRRAFGITALVLALITIVAHPVPYVVLAATGQTEAFFRTSEVWSPMVGMLILFILVVAFLAPVSVATLVLGIVSQFRDDESGPGKAAIVIGALGSLGLFLLPEAISAVTNGVV